MKRTFLILLMGSASLFGGIQFDANSSEERTEMLISEQNELLKQIHSSLLSMQDTSKSSHELLAKILKALHPYAFDQNGKLCEEE